MALKVTLNSFLADHFQKYWCNLNKTGNGENSQNGIPITHYI
jgi:hypothetical protein